ncbi:MAG: hypothetical protein WA154_11745 [Moraxellaceae bacterium]
MTNTSSTANTPKKPCTTRPQLPPRTFDFVVYQPHLSDIDAHHFDNLEDAKEFKNSLGNAASYRVAKIWFFDDAVENGGVSK